MFPILLDADNENGNLWHDFLSVALDPAHILSELAFTIVFDGLIIAVLWGVVFKRWILPRLRNQIHQEIDDEHGIDHHVHTTDATSPEHHAPAPEAPLPIPEEPLDLGQ